MPKSSLSVTTRRRPGEQSPTRPASPRTNAAHERKRGGTCYTFLLRFPPTIMFLLGLTYAVVVLIPLVRHEHALLTSASATTTRAASSDIIGDWSNHLFNPIITAAQYSNSSAPDNKKDINNIPAIHLEQKERVISLVHIGKAGGVSLRRLTVIFCKLFFRHKRWAKSRAQHIQTCVEKHFSDKQAILSHQTKHYFHIEEYNETEMELSTSYLFTLRSPVDRVVSAYRFSHPGNCNEGNRREVWRPRGCEAEKHRNKTGLVQNMIHYTCFPSPAMEDFAQSLLRPWKRNTFWSDLGQLERRKCRYLAREMVQGYGTYGSGPHMLYNYAYYAQRSIWKYPDKEMFGIRTEHEWEDTVELDRLLGGNGNLKQNRDVSHGSEGYIPSPLSTEAYHKLCCALETEIEVYQDILERVINLDAPTKRESMESVRGKCGITTTWTEWRVECRRQLRMDLRALQPSLVVNETKYQNHKVGFDHPVTGRLLGRGRRSDRRSV